MTMGADPISLAVGMTSALEGADKKLQVFTVRKEPKDHGRGRRIEGNFQAGDTVLVVDDVITTGGSTLKAIDAIEAEGGKVAAALVLMDREEGGPPRRSKRAAFPCTPCLPDLPCWASKPAPAMLPVLIGIDGPDLNAGEEAAIRRFQPAGFVLFSRNVESVEQVRRLAARLRELSVHHPVIAVDQEGGRVVRTAALGLNLPSPSSLVRNGDFSGVVELASVTALALRCLGVNMNFAPVLDICHDPGAANALPGRCWGNNAQDVISYAGVYSSNLRRGGIQSCGKHFPGMGRAQADPHFSLPVVDLDETRAVRDGHAALSVPLSGTSRHLVRPYHAPPD